MKYIMLFLPVLFVIPQFVRADIVTPPDEAPPTFEEATLLTLELTANGAPIIDSAAAPLKVGVPQMVTYTIGYEDAWFSDPNHELTPDEKERIFNELLRDHKAYIMLWRGTPLSPSARLISYWDTKGARTGSVAAVIPEPGTYFFLIDIPDYLLHDPEGMCARVNDPIEFCLPEATLGMDIEDAWHYVNSAYASTPHPNGGAYTSKGFAGVRFKTSVPEPSIGSSNILFLPGTQGSRLYEDTILPGGLKVENQRWELTPGMSQGDAQALYSNPDGTSKKPIYTKANGAVASVDLPFLDFDVYRTFFEQLERLKRDRTIRDFRTFPYDWRNSPIDIIENGTSYGNSTRFATAAVEELAATSRTGKVTIVGHSNGGLVAKALMRKLEREGKAHLVDTVMFVGVPHLGTPKTLMPMLHGDYGALTGFGGLYLSQQNARGLVEYMPDAFALLPSAAYFEKVSDPVVNLELAPGLARSAGVPTTITGQTDFEKFVVGSGRGKPAAADIETPNTLSAALLAGAKSLHADFDAWLPPPGVKVVQIVGWGIDTPKSIRYIEKSVRSCTLFLFSCRDVTKLTHAAEFTGDGDGTVVGKSQVPEHTASTYYLDLHAANKALGKNWSHADILESKPFQEIFESLVTASGSATTTAFVKQSTPSSGSRLRLRVLSPVSLEAYDAQGRRTGKAPNPAGTDLLYKEEQIPNSYYEEFGEGKYLGLPATGSTTVRLKGLASGTFTYEVTLVDGPKSETVSYQDVPITASTTATMAINGSNTSGLSLVLDTNDDGMPDTTLTPGGSMTPHAQVRFMRSAVIGVGLTPQTTQQLVAKLTNLENLLLKNHKWDDADDDKDRFEMHKEEVSNKKLLRKAAKIERWVRIQVQRCLTIPKKRLTGPQLTLEQGQVLFTMLDRFKRLLQ